MNMKISFMNLGTFSAYFHYEYDLSIEVRNLLISLENK